MKKRLVDYHCHLDLFSDYASAFKAYGEQEIEILTVTTTPRAWRKNLEFAEKSKNIRVGLGLHPQLIDGNSREIELFEELFPQARFIGEIGLDASPRYKRTLEHQVKIFERILKKCKESAPKILSVHSIRSCKTVLDMIEQWLNKSECKTVLHWFSGSINDAIRASQLGCYFSVNHQMMNSNKFLEILPKIPAKQILTETDSPFTKLNNKPTTPKDVDIIIRMLGEFTGKGHEEVTLSIFNNLNKLEEAIL